MNKLAMNISIFLAILGFLGLSSCFDASSTERQGGGPPGTISADGFTLIGGYRFATADGGDAFSLYGPDNIEVVPPGAVLSTIKRAYCIGYYEPGGSYFENGSQVDLDRVFFVIYPHKSIEFHAPHSANRRFFGDKISAEVIFK